LGKLTPLEEVFWQPYFGHPEIVATELPSDNDLVIVGIPRLAEALFSNVIEADDG